MSFWTPPPPPPPPTHTQITIPRVTDRRRIIIVLLLFRTPYTVVYYIYPPTHQHTYAHLPGSKERTNSALFLWGPPPPQHTLTHTRSHTLTHSLFLSLTPTTHTHPHTHTHTHTPTTPTQRLTSQSAGGGLTVSLFLRTAHTGLHTDNWGVEVQQSVVNVDIADAAHKVLLRHLTRGWGPGQTTQLHRSCQVQQAMTVNDGVVTPVKTQHSILHSSHFQNSQCPLAHKSSYLTKKPTKSTHPGMYDMGLHWAKVNMDPLVTDLPKLPPTTAPPPPPPTHTQTGKSPPLFPGCTVFVTSSWVFHSPCGPGGFFMCFGCGLYPGVHSCDLP